MRVLVIHYNYEPPERTRVAISQHVRALDHGSAGHEVIYHNTYSRPYWLLDPGRAPVPKELRGQRFDAIVLHNSFLCLRWTGAHFFEIKNHFEWIRGLGVPMVAIPQDEGDHAGRLDEWLYDWGVRAVLTVHHDGTDASPLYPNLRRVATFHRCYPGYIDPAVAEAMAPRLRPTSRRGTDIVYRATRLPYWFGSAGQIKHRVSEVVADAAARRGLRTDISTRQEDGVFGGAWLDFLAGSRATIGCEGGSSVLDWYGEIKAQIEAVLAKSPDAGFEEVSAAMPAGWDDYRFLTITPRHFEAILTRTCQILVEGRYRGVLEPDVHYIPVRRDFADVDEALDKLRDDALVDRMTERAWEDVYRHGQCTYRDFARLLETALEEAVASGATRSANTMDDERNEITALQRQLIAERHNSELLQARLAAAQTQASVAQAAEARALQQLEVANSRLLESELLLRHPAVAVAREVARRWRLLVALGAGAVVALLLLVAMLSG